MKKPSFFADCMSGNGCDGRRGGDNSVCYFRRLNSGWSRVAASRVSGRVTGQL